MIRKVYITKTSSFFPNSPVTNDDMEKYLGLVDGKTSRVRPIILRQNGIKTRYYALDEQQQITHSNAEMARNAIDGLLIAKMKNQKFSILRAPRLCRINLCHRMHQWCMEKRFHILWK